MTGIGMMIIVFIFIVIVIFAVCGFVLLIALSFENKKSNKTFTTLKECLACGEISKEEYSEKKRLIKN